jgi:hypothetical protein
MKMNEQFPDIIPKYTVPVFETVRDDIKYCLVEKYLGQVPFTRNLDGYSLDNGKKYVPTFFGLTLLYHYGITRLDNGKYVLIYDYGNHAKANVISEDIAAKTIIDSGHFELFEDFKFKDLKKYSELKEYDRNTLSQEQSNVIQAEEITSNEEFNSFVKLIG